MGRSITDRDRRRWKVRLVGPYGIGPTPVRPSMWDLAFESEDNGERVSVPILPGAFATITDEELVALLEDARKRCA
jgi:hypothetical protein